MADHSSTLSPETESNQHTSSGLPVWLGFFGVLIFGLAGLGLARTSNFPLELIPARWPGINLVAVIMIALAVGGLFTLTFSTMGAFVRRPAPDYVLASRLISAPIAFASSWTFVIVIALFAGGAAGSIARQTIPYLFNTFGTIFQYRELLTLVESTATPQAAILIGTAVVVVAFLILTMPPKTLLAMLRIGFILVLISWAILMLQLIIPSGMNFTASYDKIFGSGTYAQQVELAYQYGMETTAPGFRIVLLVGLFSGFYLFFGASLSAQSCSEIHKPSKSLIPGSMTALLLAGGLVLAGMILLQKVVPVQFLAAQSYLAQKEVEVAGLALPWLPFYAAIAQPIFGVSLVIGISWIYLMFLMVMVLIFVISRIVLAWSRDGVIPERIGMVPARQQSPLLAVLIGAVAVQVGLIDAVQGGMVYSWMHLALFLSVTQLLPVAALVLYPVLGKKVTGKAQIRPVRMVLASGVGLVTLLYLLWTIAAVFIYPVRLQEIHPETFTLLGACLMSGLLFYFARWFYLRRQGKSIKDAFQSIPPEC